MKLKTKYILFVAILHLVTLCLSFLIFKNNKIVFIVSEVFVFISLWLSWRLYFQLIQPLKMLLQGVNAIKDQDFNVKFRLTGKYEADQLIGVYNQMIDSLRSERTRQEEQHKFLDKLISTSPTGVIILDFDHNIEHLNPKAMQLLGIPDDGNLMKQIAACDHILMREIKDLGPGESKIVSITGIENYKCQKSFFMDRGFPRYFVMLEELSIEILQTEKKAYGKVIRMMAHEVNNTVGPVNSIMEFAHAYGKRSGDPNQELQNALKVAIERNDNLNLFMRNLADVVRLPPANKRSFDLNELVRSICKLFEFRAGMLNIRFRLFLPEKPVFINADAPQMEQVLINIIKNSAEAIGSAKHGEISVMIQPDPLRIIVRDTGKGIPEETEVNLFTPFYSTKKEGQGIGLTLIREVLINHGFGFSLKTSSNGFTDFVIFL